MAASSQPDQAVGHGGAAAAVNVSAPVALDDVICQAIELVAERNFDLYEEDEAGSIRKL